MQRLAIPERDDWRATAEAHGFVFHTLDGDPYWDESACYRFSLHEIEEDLETAVGAVEEMCFAVVERAVADHRVLARLGIPQLFFQTITDSWHRRERNLYGRMDFAYDGNGPPKLYEYNADTPTALYESAVFQWLWLEQAMARGLIPDGCDQFNSLHERLEAAFGGLGIEGRLHCCWSGDSVEDRGTTEYIADCAVQAGLEVTLLRIEEIGIDPAGRFTDTDDQVITTLFKLYPWEWLMADPFGQQIPASGTRFIEPPWKAILSNKGVLALLWEMFEGHPNLLPAAFADTPAADALRRGGHVEKPLLGREGANVTLRAADGRVVGRDGPYGGGAGIVQALHPLPALDGRYPVCGCWVVASEPAGLGIREDTGPITTDDARFVPHVILD